MTIEDEEHRYHLFRKLRYEKGLSNEEIIQKVYPGSFFGGKTLQEKVVKLDEWWELDLGDIPPRDRKRYGEPGSGRDAPHTTDLTTNSRTYGQGIPDRRKVPTRLDKDEYVAKMRSAEIRAAAETISQQPIEEAPTVAATICPQTAY